MPTTCMRSPKRKRLRNRCFATATDINRCSVARSIEVTMVGRYHSIDRDYQGQLSKRLRSRVLMHAYATRGLGFLVRCAIISRQLGQGRQQSGGSPLFMINHRSSIYVMRKVWIGTIRRLSCARNLWIHKLRNNLWIAHAIHGLYRAQCMDRDNPWIVLRKLWIPMDHTCLAQSMDLTACIQR